MSANWKTYLTISCAIVAAGLALLATFALAGRRNEVVGFNQEVLYDDFAFSVVAVRKSPTLGGGVSQSDASGIYYVVSVKVTNHARRVNYSFKPDSPVLVDDQGREFHASAEGQKAMRVEKLYNAGCGEVVRPGSACVTDVVFDVPADARNLHLRMSFGSVGDLLDKVFYGDRRISLEPDMQ
jgi:uncharacterized protein DUF4352